jgi:hypothetical protein
MNRTDLQLVLIIKVSREGGNYLSFDCSNFAVLSLANLTALFPNLSLMDENP